MIPFSSLSSIPVPIPGLLVNLNSIRRHANEAGLPSAIKIDRHDKADLYGPLIPNRSDVRFQTLLSLEYSLWCMHEVVRVKSHSESTPISLPRDLRSSSLYRYGESRGGQTVTT